MCNSKYPFKIKTFGKDRHLSSIDELKNTLSSEFAGRHVSIVFRLQSGVTRVVYVSVEQTGEVRESYGDERPVDFNDIAEQCF
jgi:hypothetical protein